MDDVDIIIERIDDILQNNAGEPLDMLGSYIVGATIVRDDIDECYRRYPLLEKVAELGAELETLGGSKYAEEVFQEVKTTFENLKLQLMKSQ